MIYGELVQKWRKASGGVLRRWPHASSMLSPSCTACLANVSITRQQQLCVLGTAQTRNPANDVIIMYVESLNFKTAQTVYSCVRLLNHTLSQTCLALSANG